MYPLVLAYNPRLNNLISVITYLIYKKYLTDKDNAYYCNNTPLLQFIKKDLEFKVLTYYLNPKTSEEY